MQLSISASKREMAEGFLVSGCCLSSDFYTFVELSFESYESDGFKMECTRTCRFSNIHTAGALAETPKEQMEPQICFKR